jgi:hypothetical protein
MNPTCKDPVQLAAVHRKCAPQTTVIGFLHRSFPQNSNPREAVTVRFLRNYPSVFPNRASDLDSAPLQAPTCLSVPDGGRNLTGHSRHYRPCHLPHLQFGRVRIFLFKSLYSACSYGDAGPTYCCREFNAFSQKGAFSFNANQSVVHHYADCKGQGRACQKHLTASLEQHMPIILGRRYIVPSANKSLFVQWKGIFCQGIQVKKVTANAFFTILFDMRNLCIHFLPIICFAYHNFLRFSNYIIVHLH